MNIFHIVFQQSNCDIQFLLFFTTDPVFLLWPTFTVIPRGFLCFPTFSHNLDIKEI